MIKVVAVSLLLGTIGFVSAQSFCDNIISINKEMANKNNYAYGGALGMCAVNKIYGNAAKTYYEAKRRTKIDFRELPDDFLDFIEKNKTSEEFVAYYNDEAARFCQQNKDTPYCKSRR